MPPRGQLPLSIRRKYPAMLSREILIWIMWLRMNKRRFESYEYNVRVGAGRDPGAGFPQEYRDMAILGSQFRIDVLAWAGTQATIVEVEETPGAKGIGQLFAYETHWIRDNPTLPRPRLMLVCANVSQDPLLVAQRAGIEVNVIPTDFSILRQPEGITPQQESALLAV
jgi:hypothetical protein